MQLSKRSAGVHPRVKAERIAELDAELGRFLDEAVATGTFCYFRP
jgi:hypothetical protein